MLPMRWVDPVFLVKFLVFSSKLQHICYEVLSLVGRILLFLFCIVEYILVKLTCSFLIQLPPLYGHKNSSGNKSCFVQNHGHQTSDEEKSI